MSWRQPARLAGSAWILGLGLQGQVELDQVSSGGEAWCLGCQSVASPDLGDTQGHHSTLLLMSYRRQGTSCLELPSGMAVSLAVACSVCPLTAVSPDMTEWWWVRRAGEGPNLWGLWLGLRAGCPCFHFSPRGKEVTVGLGGCGPENVGQFLLVGHGVAPHP